MKSRILLLLGAGVALLGILTLTSIGRAVDHPKSDLTGTMLAVSSRSNLSVCVAGVAGFAVTGAKVRAVQEALNDGLASVSDRYANAETHRQGLQSDVGCPASMAVLAGGEGTAGRPDVRRYDDLLSEPARHTALASVSQARVFVYFVPTSVFAATFGDKPYARGPAEFLCAGTSCAEVTTAIYVTPLVAPGVLQEGLLDAIGYLPSAALGDPPRGFDDPEEERRRRRSDFSDGTQ